jgi:hypothetical protein
MRFPSERRVREKPGSIYRILWKHRKTIGLRSAIWQMCTRGTKYFPWEPATPQRLHLRRFCIDRAFRRMFYRWRIRKQKTSNTCMSSSGWRESGISWIRCASPNAQSYLRSRKVWGASARIIGIRTSSNYCQVPTSQSLCWSNKKLRPPRISIFPEEYIINSTGVAFASKEDPQSQTWIWRRGTKNYE